MLFVLKILYRRLMKRALRRIVLGRMIERDRPERGRFLRQDVDAILHQTSHNIDRLLPYAELERLPTIGNRHNVFLAVVTIAAYHAFLDAGIEKSYAIELVSDAGWNLYTKFIALPRFIARLRTSDPQKQMNLILSMLLIFPFDAPGRPGYEVKAWAESGRFFTHWTYCPPYHFVKRYVETNGDRGELDAFRKSWCWYDWAFANLMMEGKRNAPGYYERPHTLSAGDSVCDMCWYAVIPQQANRTRQIAHMDTGKTSVALSDRKFYNHH